MPADCKQMDTQADTTEIITSSANVGGKKNPTIQHLFAVRQFFINPRFWPASPKEKNDRSFLL